MLNSVLPKDVVLSFRTKHLLNPTHIVFIKAPQLWIKNQVSLRHPLPIFLVLRDERLHGAHPSYWTTQISWQKEAQRWTVRQPCAPWDALGSLLPFSTHKCCDFSWSFASYLSQFLIQDQRERRLLIFPPKNFLIFQVKQADFLCRFLTLASCQVFPLQSV